MNTDTDADTKHHLLELSSLTSFLTQQIQLQHLSAQLNTPDYSSPQDSNPRIHRFNIQIPINLTPLPIPPPQPLIRLLKMPTLKPPATRTQRTRMHTRQHTMPLPVHLAHPLSRRTSPRKKHHTPKALLINDINDLLREFLPASVCVGIRFVGADGEAGVEEQDAAVGPWG